MVLASVPAAEGVGWPDALPLLPHPAELIIGLIAFGVVMTFFELLVQFLQAFIFTLLSALYISDAVSEHH